MVSISQQNKTLFKSRSSKDIAFSQRDSVTIVHLSDLHLACADGISWHQLLNKRILGYLRWRLGRRREFDYRIFAILERELQQIKPDQVIITGDLTHLGLPSEFKAVSKWLEKLGPSERITIVPGNHDTYVETDWAQTFFMWEGYILPYSSYEGRLPPPGLEDVFPILHQVKNVAIIGVSTAVPCPWHLAIGEVGTGQLCRLEAMLEEAASMGCFRIIALHHPPGLGSIGSRKALKDAGRLVRILEDRGCELILHGHSHQSLCYTLKGPRGDIPVIEAPSALCVRSSKSRKARYFTCKIVGSGQKGWKCRVEDRIFSNFQKGFVSVKQEEFVIAGSSHRSGRRS